MGVRGEDCIGISMFGRSVFCVGVLRSISIVSMMSLDRTNIVSGICSNRQYVVSIFFRRGALCYIRELT